MYRLLNVLFSDGFHKRFAETGKQYTRAQLDAGEIGKSDTFWADVAEAYKQEGDTTYGNLLFVGDEFEGIDCTYILPHDAMKLRDIWKDVNARFRKALGNFGLSGTHDSNFRNFCSKMDEYYLHLCVQMRPGIYSIYVFIFIHY